MKLGKKLGVAVATAILTTGVLAPMQVMAAESGQLVKVSGYAYEEKMGPEISVSGAIKEIKASMPEMIKNAVSGEEDYIMLDKAYSVGETTITTLEDGSDFNVYKLNKVNGQYQIESVVTEINGEMTIMVPGKADANGDITYEEKVIKVKDLPNYTLEDMPTYHKGCSVTLTEPGEYYIVFRYPAIGDSTEILVEVQGKEEAKPEVNKPETVKSETVKPEVIKPEINKPALPSQATAVATASKVMVDNQAIAFEAYNINSSNYIKLRDFASVIAKSQKAFDVQWDQEKGAINLVSNTVYTGSTAALSTGDGKDKSATLNTAPIYKDGETIELTAYTINSNNYFKLRDLAAAFGIAVNWDEATNTIVVDTTAK